jgi:2-octaprenyl-6-methoxyphenol hydroxylase
MLERYHRSRIADVHARAAGIEALNRTSMLAAQPLRDARAAGLRVLHRLGPLRKGVMQLGLGVPKAS